MKSSIITKTILSTSVLALLCAAASAQNLLLVPGFETNFLTSYSNVLNNFTANQGLWGVESTTISLATVGVIPLDGTRMLSMTNDGGTTTQAVQATDVTTSASLIDLGGATVHFSAFFNAADGLPAPRAAVLLHFYTGAGLSFGAGSISTSLTTDGDPSTWEQISTSGAIPVGTRWLVSEVLYTDASLITTNAGFVDAASLTITPEPSSALLMIGSGAMLLLRRRRAAAL